jgi:hypothetical protein
VIETSSFLCLHTSIHNFLRCGIGCNLKLKFFSVHEYACICNLLNFISFPFFFTITYILGCLPSPEKNFNYELFSSL